MTPFSATEMWYHALLNVTQGRKVSPRGKATREVPQATYQTNMLKPAVVCPPRKLSHAFMAAEAYWILMGDDSVAGIEAYSQTIKQFSDDGIRFAGAYGPMVATQLDFVINKLKDDPDSRQAGMTIWKPNPPLSKDIPCTIALWFQVRGNLLNCHAFMRSSDAFIGLIYDTFVFSMVATYVCAKLNMGSVMQRVPGTLYLTAASSHLYEADLPKVKELLADQDLVWPDCKPTPAELYAHSTGNPRPDQVLMSALRLARDNVSHQWWRP